MSLPEDQYVILTPEDRRAFSEAPILFPGDDIVRFGWQRSRIESISVEISIPDQPIINSRQMLDDASLECIFDELYSRSNRTLRVLFPHLSKKKWLKMGCKCIPQYIGIGMLLKCNCLPWMKYHGENLL